MAGRLTVRLTNSQTHGQTDRQSVNLPTNRHTEKWLKDRHKKQNYHIAGLVSSVNCWSLIKYDYNETLQ